MRFDLSDEEWALSEPLMPSRRKSGRADDRQVMKNDFLRAAHADAVA
jgi:transposase